MSNCCKNPKTCECPIKFTDKIFKLIANSPFYSECTDSCDPNHYTVSLFTNDDKLEFLFGIDISEEDYNKYFREGEETCGQCGSYSLNEKGECELGCKPE